MVRHPDYLPAKRQVEVKIGAITAVEIKIEAAPPKVGTVRGKVLDTKGAAVEAEIAVTGPETKKVRAAADGTYALEVQPGAYNVAVEAPGYLRKEQDVALTAGATATVNFTISPKPKRSLVRVTRRAIVIRRKVHFAINTAEIRPDSRQLLDEVAHVLLANSKIQVLEIGGHTDNSGSDALNMKLSQERAEAVRDYLIGAGVSPERLQAKGYGSTRPKVPNITNRNRARNRRVEFRIRSQQR
jgi:outer membrane protein OmpA-like peptidoglycan-associated protein